MAVRAENAALKKKEAEVERAMVEKAKADRAAKINADFEALTKPPTSQEGEKQPTEETKRRKRKPARRVIVTEASSASESEDDEVEVVLPRARKQPSAEEVAYRRAVEKMFSW